MMWNLLVQEPPTAEQDLLPVASDLVDPCRILVAGTDQFVHAGALVKMSRDWRTWYNLQVYRVSQAHC